MQLTYFGHSAFSIKTEEYEILIDPFLKYNPHFDANLFENIKPDFILITHGHGDHVGDAFELAKIKNATIVAPFELANIFSSHGIKTHPMHIGGAFNFPFGQVKLTIAVHGSAFSNPIDGTTVYAGNPCGFLITINGKTIYHAGDTGLFYDMKLIGEMNEIDYALLPIGDNFTMGIDDSIKAIEFLKPKYVIPMHYNTFDVIKVSDEKMQKLLSKENIVLLKPNNSIEI